MIIDYCYLNRSVSKLTKKETLWAHRAAKSQYYVVYKEQIEKSKNFLPFTLVFMVKLLTHESRTKQPLRRSVSDSVYY